MLGVRRGVVCQKYHSRNRADFSDRWITILHNNLPGEHGNTGYSAIAVPRQLRSNCYIVAVQNYDVIVLGGGAAGLMCAIEAGRRGRSTLVIDSSNKIGKKILMSGGGRCNFTNLNCSPDNFLSANPDFCISALSRFSQWDFIALVEKHRIAYHEKEDGQLFCDGWSREILSMLEAECQSVETRIITDCSISSIEFHKRFELSSATNEYSAESLVVATGGLSIPKMGASGFGYRLAEQFGLSVNATRAGLVPFTLTGAMHDLAAKLSGVSVAVTVRVEETAFKGNLLFTHRGLSGPAALQISSYWTPGEEVRIDLLPGRDAVVLLLEAKTNQPKALLRSVLSSHLPRALVLELEEHWWPESSSRPLAELSNDNLRQLGEKLANWSIKPAATEGYRTAEVTLGGVDTNELSSKTMESKRQPGLYLVGEVVDVTGHLGGYNFQWAWASGHAAGQVV